MKKHKSVVAILLAVMMIFTMMPMMAFADDNPVKTWKGSTYDTAVDSSGVEFNTTREFIAANGDDGQVGFITATPANKKSTVEGEPDVVAPTGMAWFYDLADSAIVYSPSGQESKALDKSTWTNDAFKNVASGATALYIQLVEPTYTDSYKDAIKADPTYKAKKVFIPMAKVENTNTFEASFDSWKLVVEMSEFKEGVEADQSVTFTVKSLAPVLPAGKSIDAVEYADLTGTVAAATVAVKGKAKTVDTAGYYLDKVGGVAYNAGVYDGASHTVVADAVPGYTVSYQILNPATGKYEAASAVTITDVQKTAIQFKAIWTDAKGVSTPKGPFNLNLSALNTKRTVSIGWDQKASAVDANSTRYDYLYLVDGTEYKINDYIKVTPQEVPAPDEEQAAAAEIRVGENEAAKNAVAANDALLKEYFAAKYDVKDVTTKAAAADDQVLFTIEKKILSEADTKALNDKYEQLLRNFGTIGVDQTSVATLQLNADKIDYEIEFTKAPEGAKVIHIKKAKKLKKDKSFSVKAISNKGVAVSYKLINANSKIKINKTTGKITLKKGLKKGTYKFMVKAYVPGHSLDAFEVQNIVVKIKK